VSILITAVDGLLLIIEEFAATLHRRRGGARLSPSTIWRWSPPGRKGVLLRTFRVGSAVYVPQSALAAFVEARSKVGSGLRRSKRLGARSKK
jgi:hypothetical protein